MRITHTITKGDVGGAQTHVVELALAQRRCSDDVSIVTGLDGPAMDRARDGGVDVTIVPRLDRRVGLRANAAVTGDLRDVVRALRPDVVHAHSSKAGLLGRWVCKREGIPVVYTAHGFPFQRGAPLAQRVVSFVGEWLGGRLGDALICLTDDEAALARRWRVAAPDDIVVIPNGLPDVPWVRPVGRSGPPSMVMVARFAPPKMQSELISVLATLTDLDWTMTFIGDGAHLESCRETGRRLLGERVRFLGHRDDVEALVAGCDVALLWSRYEGMPLALMEAMRAGLACVAGDLPGVHRLFGEPPAGIVAADAARLAGVLRTVLADGDRIDELGARARARYHEAFTIDALEQRVRELYRSVIG